MNTCIITGGNINHDFALNFIKKIEMDHVIAVDRGLAFVYQHRLPVHAIIGDFDSVPEEILEFYQTKTQIPVQVLNPVKDATDTQIAIEQAVAAGSNEIWILGATGTRMDHCLGNINCLSIALRAGIPAAIVDENNCISLLDRDTVLDRNQQYGSYVSFLPFGAKVSGLNLEGFKYPLKNHTLLNTNGLGISNEIVEARARVALREGVLIMIQSKD